MDSNANNYWTKKLSVIILSVILAISIAARAFFYIINKFCGVYLLGKGLYQERIEYYLGIIIVATLTCVTLLNVRKIPRKIIVILIGIAVFAYVNFSFGFSDTYPKYFYFTSPSNMTTLIIEENSWLLSGWSNLYIKKNEFFVKDLKARISTDDGYRPFSNGDYSLSWIDNNTVKISYGFGEGNIIKTEIIKLE